MRQSFARKGILATCLVTLASAQPATATAGASEAALAREILADQSLREVHQMAHKLLQTGLTAGSGYGEVWIRDLNTFVEVALEVNEPLRFRESLLIFFKFQGADGDIVDGYIPKERANVRQAGAGSIGLTLYPTYPQGAFKNRSMVPYGYQNGGDWCWFGGRMIQQLVRNGFIAEAYRELRPMVERVKRTGDFHEWWSRDNQPRGSARFRGSAGVLGHAIKMLQHWAEQNQAPRKP